MYVRKRISRRRYYLKLVKKHGVPILLLACAGTFLCTYVLLKTAQKSATTIPFKNSITAGSSKSSGQFEPAGYERTIYPYSVIPGGIRSRGDLVIAVAKDPVVAGHYANFDLSSAKFLRSEESQTVHVAYRLKNKVFWTAKTIKIPAGETMISDGNQVARTRCGNRVSVLPQEPISEEEPAIETFDIPIIASAQPPQLDFSPPPELDTRPIEPLIPNVPVQSFLLENPQYDTHRPLALYPPRIPEVPEPGTLYLVITGLGVFLAIKFARKR